MIGVHDRPSSAEPRSKRERCIIKNNNLKKKDFKDISKDLVLRVRLALSVGRGACATRGPLLADQRDAE